MGFCIVVEHQHNYLTQSSVSPNHYSNNIVMSARTKTPLSACFNGADSEPTAPHLLYIFTCGETLHTTSPKKSCSMTVEHRMEKEKHMALVSPDTAEEGETEERKSGGER